MLLLGRGETKVSSTLTELPSFCNTTGGKVGPGRDVAKRWEPPEKPPGAQTRHSWPASPCKGECKEPVHGMRTRDSLLGRQMVARSPLASCEMALGELLPITNAT